MASLRASGFKALGCWVFGCRVELGVCSLNKAGGWGGGAAPALAELPNLS